MNEEDYNIHKIINCIFPFLNFNFLCKKKLHNYEYNFKKIELEPKKVEEENMTTIYYRTKYITYKKCRCCGKELLINE